MSPVPEDNKSRDDPEKSCQDVSNLEVPQYTLNVGTSSDSEDEDGTNGGYQLLPQDPEGGPPPYVMVDDSSDEETGPLPLDNTEDCEQPAEIVDHVSVDQTLLHSMEGGHPSGVVHSHIKVPPIESHEVIERSELWNNSTESTLQLDKEKADKIKAAMASFSIPPPAWAKVIPEEQWKARLVSSLSGQPVQQANPWSGEPRSSQSETDTQHSSTSNTQEQSSTENWANFSTDDSLQNTSNVGHDQT